MNGTPNSREQYSAHLPALHLLCDLGWNFPSTAQALTLRGSTREVLLKQDPFELIEKFQKWAAGFVAPEGSPVPGMQPEDFKKFKMPVLIFRSGRSDVPHTRRTSEWVHELIPQSKIIDPPWGDREWVERGQDVRSGKEKGLFVRWPLLAPYILDFTKS